MKKTSLAIAISEAMKEVGIEKEEENIFKIFIDSFKAKFDQFKINQGSTNTTVKAQIFNNYQYPIGEDDRQQYYTSLIYEPKFNNFKVTDSLNGEKKPLILI